LQPEEKIMKIGIESIVPNRYQPRKKFDETDIKELSDSIKTYGIINPILVRKKDDKYEIIAGERRYRAAIAAGLKEVPVIEKTLEDTTLAEIALIENIQRKDLSPIEEAESYEEIMKLSNITQQELGKKLGKSQSSIANKLRLINLPKQVKEALLNRQISERHARSLIKVDDEERQLELLERIIEEKLTVKDLDNIIDEQKITEEDIQNAINEIMKSLKLTEDDEESQDNQKEEKESDKMNNDNFFPNFSNTMGANNNISLNTMNMQSMENTPMAPVQETVMPTNLNPTQNFEMPILGPTPQIPVENITEPVQNVEMNIEVPPMMNEPIQPESSPVANMQDIPLFQAPSMETPIIQDTPLFGGNLNQPVQEMAANPMEPVIEQPIATPEAPVSAIPNFGFEQPMNQVAPTTMETPLFNNPAPVTPEMPQIEVPMVEVAPIEPPVSIPSIEEPVAPVVPSIPEVTPQEIIQPAETNINETFYEVPVNISPVIEEPTTTVDKLTKVQELLSQNGISYKSYSNDAGHCIIIEIEK